MLFFFEQVRKDIVHGFQATLAVPPEESVVVNRLYLAAIVHLLWLQLLRVEGELTLVPDLDLQDSHEFHIGNAIYRYTSAGIHHFIFFLWHVSRLAYNLKGGGIGSRT